MKTLNSWEYCSSSSFSSSCKQCSNEAPCFMGCSVCHHSPHSIQDKVLSCSCSLPQDVAAQISSMLHLMAILMRYWKIIWSRYILLTIIRGLKLWYPSLSLGTRSHLTSWTGCLLFFKMITSQILSFKVCSCDVSPSKFAPTYFRRRSTILEI